MVYVRVESTKRNQWTAFIHSKRVATITRRAGKCSVRFAADRAFSAQEASALTVDVQELEAGHLGL
jgi:hypothetical protein